MKRWRARPAILAAAAAAIAAVPLASRAQQEDSPESLLPEGFGDPAAPLPPPQQPATPAPGTPAPRPIAPAAAPGGPPVPMATSAPDRPSGELDEAELAALEAQVPKPIEIPESARRPIDIAGPLGVEQGGLGPGAWGAANGGFLSSLMRRTDAPLPSRWASMLLRRALLSRVAVPAGIVNPVDWTAERAWLLLRMGEADGARLLVQGVDVDRFTPKMLQVAAQMALATADVAALCPLIAPGQARSDERIWPLAEAMCASLRGEPTVASTAIDRARGRMGLDPVDVALAEKIVGAGANTRRSVTIEWEPVDRLSSWRFGLASAAGMEIPARLLDAADPRVWAWAARAPMVPLDRRVAMAGRAAAIGVFSNQSLVAMQSRIADEADPADYRGSIADRLRQAYVAPTLVARMEALRALWTGEGSAADLYGRHIMTAVASGRIGPNAAVGDDIDDLVASMLSAGLDARAARWSQVVDGMEGAAAERAWAMIAASAPSPTIAVSAGRIRGFSDAVGSADGRAGRILLAALAGVGRIQDGPAEDLAGELGVDIASRNRWTETLARAAQDGEPGTVALLIAAGMQARDWSGVPPEHLYHVLRALRTAGLQYEARMIAAEAIARL